MCQNTNNAVMNDAAEMEDGGDDDEEVSTSLLHCVKLNITIRIPLIW